MITRDNFPQGGIKCYSVYWVGTRGRELAGSKYYLNKKKNRAGTKHKAQTAISPTYIYNTYVHNLSYEGKLWGNGRGTIAQTHRSVHAHTKKKSCR